MLMILMLLSLFAINHVVNCQDLKIMIFADLIGILLYALYDIILFNIEEDYYKFVKSGILKEYQDYMKEHRTIYGFEESRKATIGLIVGILHSINLISIFKIALFDSFLIVAFNFYRVLHNAMLLNISLIVIVIMLSCLVISNYLSVKL